MLSSFVKLPLLKEYLPNTGIFVVHRDPTQTPAALEPKTARRGISADSASRLWTTWSPARGSSWEGLSTALREDGPVIEQVDRLDAVRVGDDDVELGEADVEREADQLACHGRIGDQLCLACEGDAQWRLGGLVTGGDQLRVEETCGV